MSIPDPYLLGYAQTEQERLERQANELAQESAALFDRIGIKPGWRVIEVGCGPRGCLGLLSERVGGTGQVVGVERGGEAVERAQRFIAEEHLTNVQVIHRDARDTEFASESFDMATARLVLVNVPQPQAIVNEMVRLVRPGGVIALHEAEATTQRYDPPLPAQERLLKILNEYAALNGIDRAIGIKVPGMLRAAGVVDVQANAFVHIYPPGHPRRMLLIDFVANARYKVLEKEMIGETELDEMTEALKQHLQDPNTTVMSSVFVQAWGRKS